jgi:hypothetical protein
MDSVSLHPKKLKKKKVGFEVLRELSMKSNIFWAHSHAIQ